MTSDAYTVLKQHGFHRCVTGRLWRLYFFLFAVFLPGAYSLAAPIEVAPASGWGNWWHVDRLHRSAQEFCDAMYANHRDGHPLHPSPAGCMDSNGWLPPRFEALPSALRADFLWAPQIGWMAQCTPTGLPSPLPAECPRAPINLITTYDAYCPIGYVVPGHGYQSAVRTEGGATANTDFYLLRGYDKSMHAAIGAGGAVKCVATQPNQIDEDKHADVSTCNEAWRGNPIHAGVGRKKQVEVDYRDRLGLLSFERHYWSGPLLGDVFANGLLSYGPRLGYIPKWRIGFRQMLHVAEGGAVSTTWAVRADGRSLAFSGSADQWLSESDNVGRLSDIRDSSNVRIGWKLVDAASRSIERYDTAGKLVSISHETGPSISLTYSTAATPTLVAPWLDLLIAVTDHLGRQLTFRYDAQGRLSSLIDPAGGEYSYSYDESSSIVLNDQRPGGNLTSVRYPTGWKRIYHYNEQQHTAGINQPNALTGVSEEVQSGQFVRLSTYAYNAQGRAISTEQSGGVNRYSINYSSPYQRSVVTDSRGVQRTYDFVTIQGVSKLISQSQPAGSGCGPSSSALTYDSQANVTSRTDFNNNKICYAYDLSRNLETKRVEGVTSSAVCSTALSSPPTGSRLISTQWHPDWRLETRIAEPKKLTTITYNGQGATCAPSTVLVDGKPPAVICTRTEQATTDETGAAGFAATVTGTARTWRYTYTTYGRVLTATDPNNRTTTTSYHPDNDADLGKRGNVASITNAANHTTFLTDYNPHGQPTRIVDPNGVVTVLTYDPRMRLTSRTVGNEATVFGYDPVGQMTSVNLPDGARLTYSYDAAHRLTAINDHKGNRIDYTLDAMGNRITEKTKDPGGVLVGNIARVIDALNRVQQVTGSN